MAEQVVLKYRGHCSSKLVTFGEGGLPDLSLENGHGLREGMLDLEQERL